jgi:Ser/Thr protein kinase RdoA (MazF antagonist)
LALLKESYGMEHPEVIYLKRGFNDTYKITADGQYYILRIYRTGRRSEEDIHAEVKLLLYLGRNGSVVSVPLPGKEDVYVHPLSAPEGMRYAVLFSFATGEVRRKPSVNQCRQAGEALGQIHHLLLPLDPGPLAWNYEPAALFAYVRSSVNHTLRDFSEELHVLDALEEDITKRLCGQELKRGICHGDPQAENFYYQEEDKVCFIDFDFTGRGPLLYDLGAYTWYDHQGKTRDMLQAFYDGYGNVLPLSKEEVELIPLFGAMRALFLMGMWNRFNDGHSNPVWPAEQIAAFVGKVKRWVESPAGGNKRY